LSAFVLDASVTLSWLFEDESTPATDALLWELRTRRATVPAIWTYEVANALASGVRRTRLSEAQSHAFAELLHALPVDVLAPPPLPLLAALATRHDLSAYDAAYLEVAQRNSLPLATLDGRLRDAARRTGVTTLPD
jgi:predicted nucleic acid-binding protein